MAESFSVKALLSAQDSGFSSTLGKASSAVDSFASKLTSGFNFGFLSGMGQQAFSMISGGISDLIGEIDSSNAAWKTFESNMSIIGKSGKEIDSAKKELQAFAEQTVYSSSDMATTFAQLEAVGVKNTTSLVKGFGGLAAAAENPQQAMKTLSTQATQMAAKPEVAWADFKLMLEQTPAGIAAVAKEMGMTTSELVTAVQEGEVATNDFFKAIEKAGTSKGFTKLATQPKTVGQALDGLKETVSNKLTPAFDVLSQKGIEAISGIADMLSGIDAQGIADSISAAFERAGYFIDVFMKSFEGVGSAFGEAFSAIGAALAETNGEFTSADALLIFKDICESVAGALKSLAGFLKDNADTIAKVIPWVVKIGGAFLALKVVNTVAPGLTNFAGALLKMAGKGVVGLVGKLFGIAGGSKAAGDAAGQSATQMAAAAKSFMMAGIGVAAIALGFALLAQSAIALANAGPLAIGVMAGLVIAVAGLALGMVALLKTVKTSPATLNSMAVAMLALGGAVVLIAVGFALLAQTSIALANSGGLAIGVMAGMIIAIAGLAAGAAFLAPALVAGAAGFTAFGTAILLVGVGALIAAVALAIVVAVLPAIIQYGMQGAAALSVLGLGLMTFAAGAALAGVAALALGVGLGVVGVALGVVAVAAGVLAVAILGIATGMLLAAAAVAIMAAILPTIAEYGTSGAMAFIALAGGLTLFGAGALVAGVGAGVLAVALLAATVGIAAAAVAVGALAVAMGLLAATTIIAGVGFALIGAGVAIIAASGAMAAGILMSLIIPMTMFAPVATIAGAAATVLGGGFTIAAISAAALAIAILALGVGLTVLALGAALAAGGIALLALTLPMITANAMQNYIALTLLGAGLLAFAPGALAAGGAAIVLGLGFATMAIATALAGAAIAVLAVGLLALSLAAMAGAGAIALVALALPAMIAVATQGAAALMIISGALIAFAGATAAAGLAVGVMVLALAGFALSTAAAALAVGAFGLAMAAGAIGVAAMALGLVAVNASMQTIADNAKSAEKSLDSMKDSVDIVESGLSALGDMAKSAMKGLVDAFDGAKDDAKSSGKELGAGFTKGVQGGLMQAPMIAIVNVAALVTALKAGRSGAYSAGAYISQGFAQGMLSQLGVIQAAASKMAAAADKAVRAKAKIKSPSRVSMGLGAYWGEGFANGIADMAKDAWRAAEDLVSIPQIATPALATAYGGEMSPDYDYIRNSDYTIEVPLTVDGKEFARVTASYTQDELDRRQTRNERKRGRV